MPLQKQVLVEKDLQSKSKVSHLIADLNHASFPTLEKSKAKRTTALHTTHHQRNLLFMKEFKLC